MKILISGQAFTGKTKFANCISEDANQKVKHKEITLCAVDENTTVDEIKNATVILYNIERDLQKVSSAIYNEPIAFVHLQDTGERRRFHATQSIFKNPSNPQDSEFLEYKKACEHIENVEEAEFVDLIAKASNQQIIDGDHVDEYIADLIENAFQNAIIGSMLVTIKSNDQMLKTIARNHADLIVIYEAIKSNLLERIHGQKTDMDIQRLIEEESASQAFTAYAECQKQIDMLNEQIDETTLASAFEAHMERFVRAHSKPQEYQNVEMPNPKKRYDA